MIRDYVFDNSRDTLDNIAKYWGITKKEIIELPLNCSVKCYSK
mgnify:CR=1 FL=1